ncbi:hypothetical protein CLHUN_40180 [Ruminiclostridium hungatei]|uniref:Carbohydrate-binding domain-containing protein n=1 Tax=Ruminiclostridium hungatei TaxID=48256 RepID=A0A1V4SEE7_RUMHU|nr:carbohydrate-binding domain-containing protein [Ruminiclostridium hungatei]OPX42113.1 hypothetical protein CLHUN_40180 [Ruminiclostridium hungatei]
MHNKKLKYKFTSAILTIFLSISLLTACTLQTTNIASSNNTAITTSSKAKSGSTPTPQTDISVKYDSTDVDTGWDSESSTKITFSSDTINGQGEGIVISKNIVTITSAGTYIISGTINNGRIIVDTKDDQPVRLVLNGADITSTESAPICITSAKKAVLILPEGTKNNITDGKNYVFDNKEADEPDSAIFSKSDLTINGTGSLTINANYKNAITSKDELKIMSGNITLNSTGDGMKGRDFVAIKDGIVNINAKEDGIKSNNDEDAKKGFVLIEGGSINIIALEDGIQAETDILIKTAAINITSGGGYTNGETKADEQPGMGGPGRGFDFVPSDTAEADSTTRAPADTGVSGDSTATESESKKGLKAADSITIESGTLEIDSADDSIHSNNIICINGGTVSVSSGDDGIHADAAIYINNGDTNVLKAYEGIESANIIINNGNITVSSSDDGINVSGGADSSSTGGRAGQNSFNTSGSDSLQINGGYVYVDSQGDGLDANGSIYITNGTVVVNGPTGNNNGALDYDGAFKMTGGFLIAAGSSGMAQAPDTSSTQNSAMISFDQVMPAGTIINITSGDGKELLTFKPAKGFQTIVVNSPELKKGTTYDIYYGGSSSGSEKNGLSEGGTFSGGTKYESFTVTGLLTTIGTVGRSGPGGGPGGGQGFPGRRNN